jgi:hypothetical protein
MKVIKGIAMITLTLIGLGFLLPYLWPYVEDTIDLINTMSGGDSVSIIQVYWPILVIIVAIVIGIAVIVYALRELGIIGGEKTITYRSKRK